MFVQGLPDPRSHSFNLLVGAPQESNQIPQNQPPIASPPTQRNQYKAVEPQSVKVSSGVKIFRLQ
jgi:hypothetical protein